MKFLIWRVLFMAHVSDEAFCHILNSESTKCGKWINTKYLEQETLWLHIQFYLNFLNKQQMSARGTLWHSRHLQWSNSFFIVHKFWRADIYSELSELSSNSTIQTLSVLHSSPLLQMLPKTDSNKLNTH